MEEPMDAEKGYNGWKNRQTWNVALWVGNDEPLYLAAVDYVKRQRAAGKRVSYAGFAREMGLAGDKTPDGIAWTGTRLDYRHLSEMMRELVS